MNENIQMNDWWVNDKTFTDIKFLYSKWNEKFPSGDKKLVYS